MNAPFPDYNQTAENLICAVLGRYSAQEVRP